MKKIEIVIVLALLIFSLVPLVDLMNPGLPVTHDGEDHVARIASFYQSITEGNIIPRWAANLNWGYGHPILMFLYPLPSYFASLFHGLGFSFVDSTKLVFATAFFVSIFSMYLWLRAHWGVMAGFVGAILYGFAPYRFVDLYVRGAIGEHVAFVFPPLMCLSLFLLIKKKRQNTAPIILLSLATAGLILSHNALSLMFLPLVILYALYLIFFMVPRPERLRFVWLSAWGILLGFLLSAFFWIPAFFEGKYTLRDIVTKGDFAGRFVPWAWFIYSPWNYGGGNEFTKQLGVPHIVMIFGTLFFLMKRNATWFISVSLITLVAVLFLMTGGSSWIWYHVSILQKFQFPWRLLSVTTFLSATLGAVVISHVPKKIQLVTSCVLVILAIALAVPMWKAKDYSMKPESFYTGVYQGTTDTGESSPIWSVRFMEHVPTAPMQVIDGSATIDVKQRKTTGHLYTIQAAKKTRFVENTLYFPGWNITVDGQPAPIEFQDPSYRGLMTFWTDPGVHTVEVKFGDTRVRSFANLMSIVAILLLAATPVIFTQGNHYGKTTNAR